MNHLARRGIPPSSKWCVCQKKSSSRLSLFDREHRTEVQNGSFIVLRTVQFHLSWNIRLNDWISFEKQQAREQWQEVVRRQIWTSPDHPRALAIADVDRERSAHRRLTGCSFFFFLGEICSNIYSSNSTRSTNVVSPNSVPRLALGRISSLFFPFSWLASVHWAFYGSMSWAMSIFYLFPQIVKAWKTKSLSRIFCRSITMSIFFIKITTWAGLPRWSSWPVITATLLVHWSGKNWLESLRWCKRSM